MSDNLGRVFLAVSEEAWRAFSNDEHERAQRLARRLLLEPRLGKSIKATMHMILATGSDDYVYHARQSLELYEHLFDDVQPTTEDEELRQVCLAHARELVEKGVEDEKNINDRLLAKYGSSEAVAEALLRRIGNQATEALGKQEAFLQAEEEAEEEIQEGDQGQQTSGPEEAELAGNEHDERVHDVVEETPAGEVEREEQQSPPTNPFLRDGSLQLPRYPPLPEGTMTLSEMMKKGLR